MRKTKKTGKIIAVVLIAALLAGGGTAAGLFLSRSVQPVRVFAVSEIGQTDMWMDQTQYDGEVRADHLQAVYLSDTQQLKEIYVKEGDAVKKGDRLAAFDTTLSELELERQKLTVQKLEAKVTAAQAELTRIGALTPYTPAASGQQTTPQPAEDTPLQPETLPLRLGGDGSAESPYVYLWNDACRCDAAFIGSFLPNLAESAACVIFEVRDSDNRNGRLLRAWGTIFEREADGSATMTFFEPDLPQEESGEMPQESLPEEGQTEPEASGYTAAEIAKMKEKAQFELRDLQTELKTEQLRLKRLELELSTGIVTAQLDGIVKSAVSEEEARREQTPLLTVSAGGAWSVTANVSELDLENLHVGDSVTVESWMDGETYEGSVTAVSRDPAADGWFGGSGNPNVSYYPVTVEVEAGANLQNGDYVAVSFSASGGGAGLYLEAPYIRKEAGRSYVYAADENGKLERREIRTGRIFWGSTVEILDGVTLDDAIAFPYGKNVKPGAPTELSDVSALYEDMYY